MSAFASHRDNPIVEGVPMRFKVSDNGVPEKTGEMWPENRRYWQSDPG